MIVFVRRFDDGVRRVERISELTGLEEGTPQLQDLFAFRRTSRQGRRIEGSFAATGIVPRFVHELRETDPEVSFEIFRRPSEGEA